MPENETPMLFTFREHDITISGEKHHLMEFAKKVYSSEFSNVWTDLAYQILIAFDEDFRKESES